MARLAPHPTHAESVRFCSRCGTVRERGEEAGRVCGSCGMGVLLTAPAGAVKGPDNPFLVVSDELRVVAVSSAAEKLFGEEAALLSSSLLSTLSGIRGDAALARAARRAALGTREMVTLPVMAPGASRLQARIAPCGPPPAALVVIELALRVV